jgi:hypothetical protein
MARQPAARFDINAPAAESGFTVFMRKELPEDLRRAALRSDLARFAREKLPVGLDKRAGPNSLSTINMR